MKTLFTCLNLILLTVILYFCVTIMYGKIETALFKLPVLSTPQDKGNQEQKPGEMKKTSQGLRPTAIITQRNLFKASVEPARQNKTAMSDLKEEAELTRTTLNLKLWGTVAGMGSQSFAVIQEEASKTQTLYHEGDTVARAIIKKILRSSVVLTYNGEDQILEMETQSPKGNAPRAAPVLTPQNDVSTMTIEKSVIDDAINDMETLAKQVRVRPHFSRGKPDGLLIYGIKNNTLFNKLGLKNGDILMGVDNKELTSISDALSMYQSLSQASEAKLKLKRRGKTKEIIYNVQQ